MRVNQFWFPAATWVVETTSSLTPITPGTSRRIASASSIFNVPAPPQPVRIPLEVVLPEKTKITFCPRLAICASTCAFAPLPIPTMAMTAPTPMLIPRAVSTERILFRRNARYATLNVGPIRIVQGWSDGVPECWSIAYDLNCSITPLLHRLLLLKQHSGAAKRRDHPGSIHRASLRCAAHKWQCPARE